MRVLLGAVIVGQLVTATRSPAQANPSGRGGAWRVALTVGTSTFNGAAAGTDSEGSDLVFRPFRPTMVGLALSYGRDRLRLGLSAKYGQPGLGFRGQPEEAGAESLLIVVEDAFSLATFTASAGIRLATLRGGPTLRSSVGLTLERWSAEGTSTRVRVGPQAGLGLEFALTGALIATIDGELGFTPGSPFLTEDLPEGFRLRSTWRRTLQAGVSLRL
jgi:hypothetical protein